MTKSFCKTRVVVRWMIRRDLPQVLAIEKENFEFPWSETEVIKFLRQNNSIGTVAEIDNEVIGYMFHRVTDQRYYLESLSVDVKYQRSGIGSSLIDHLKRKFGSRRNSIRAQVRESNLAAQLFFKSQGFICKGIDRKPFDCCDEDGYVMIFKKVGV